MIYFIHEKTDLTIEYEFDIITLDLRLRFNNIDLVIPGNKIYLKIKIRDILSSEFVRLPI